MSENKLYLPHIKCVRFDLDVSSRDFDALNATDDSNPGAFIIFEIDSAFMRASRK
jgi:hypothetical protein